MLYFPCLGRAPAPTAEGLLLWLLLLLLRVEGWERCPVISVVSSFHRMCACCLASTYVGTISVG